MVLEFCKIPVKIPTVRKRVIPIIGIVLGTATIVSPQLPYEQSFAAADGNLPYVRQSPAGNMAANGYFGTNQYNFTNSVTGQHINGQTAVYRVRGVPSAQAAFFRPVSMTP